MTFRSIIEEPWREFVIAVLIVLAFLVDRFSPFGSIALGLTAGLAVFPTFLHAFQSLLKKKLTIDTFNAFAVTASYITGEFRSAAFIGLMLSFARYLDWRTESRARHAIEELLRLKPDIARRETATGAEDVPANSVKKDEVVIVATGTRIPVDGVVIGGEAYVNEASVTGESVPIRKIMDDRVVSATLVVSGGIRVRATAVGSDSTIERMADLIREATENKSRSERLADKFAGIFLPIVGLIGLGTYLITHDLRMVASIFLVSCADDMAVAIPLAITAAVGRAAKRGVVLKGGEWLEVLARAKIVVLDKTGTLTYGSLTISRVDIQKGVTEKRFWQAVGSAEKFSEHPIGKLAYDEAVRHVPSIADPLSVRVLEGRGMSAKTTLGSVAVGNIEMVDELGLKIPPDVRSKSGEGSGTAFYVFLEGAYAGMVSVADKPRPEAAASLKQLQKLGIVRTIMYTGDNARTAEAVSSELGITELHAGMSPKQKLTELEQLLPAGPVIMVGDGINDAPALARADVGIAMGGGGTAIASEAADVVILSDNLGRLPEMIELGRQTSSVIHWDMAIWVVTNFLGFALVFTGILGPSLAAFYNFFTDFLPLLNSTRLFRRPAE